MKDCSEMFGKLFAIGLLLAVFALNTHATGTGGPGDITGEVVTLDFDSRHIALGDHAAEKRYRVALAAKITLLDSSKGALEDVLLGDEVLVKLDSETGDIRDLSVISQH